MTKKKMDYFEQAGVVSPMEYPWYAQFQKMGKMMYSDPKNNQQIVDVGKVLGLARYTADLQKASRKLAKLIVMTMYEKRISYAGDIEKIVELSNIVEEVMSLTDHAEGRK